VQAELTTSAPSAVAAAVRRHLAGDVAATEILAARAAQLSLRTAVALLGSREEAGDVSQDVAVDVLRSLGKLRDPDAFDAWTHRITVRHALRRLKRRRGARQLETPLALLPEAAEPPAREEIDRETLLATRQALAVALASLVPKQRLVLVLRYVHDLSDAEIAAALDCRLGSVHALLSRGRAALREDSQLAELALAFEGG
jgi:RNA polymerase sigma factor (sigma-70 family)